MVFLLKNPHKPKGEKEEVKVRMNFIDTPEIAQAYGQKAKVALTNLVKGQVVFEGSSESLQAQPEIMAQHLGV